MAAFIIVEGASMFPGAKVFEAVGRYGGLPGLVFLVYAATIYVLSKMKGTAEQGQKRFLVLAWFTLFFGVFVIGSYFYTNSHQTTAGVSVTTTNTTTGKLSPIIPGNCGPITIKDQPNTPAEKEKP
jgi:apolipoprotein N-acyltransferase